MGAFRRKQKDGDKADLKKQKYLIKWYDSYEKRFRTTAASTDKEVAEAMGRQWAVESQKRALGFTSSVMDEMAKPVDLQLAEFLTSVRRNNPKPKHLYQLERRIRRVLKAIKATRLMDIKPGDVEAEVLKLRDERGFTTKAKLLSVSTRNEHIANMMQFTSWALGRKKLEHDPLACLSKTQLKDEDRVHRRRGLTVDEIARWLDATVRRPIDNLLTIRTGPNRGQKSAKVRERVLDKARQTGINRRNAYLTAIWTGLRRNELTLLEWRDVFLDDEHPHAQLRGSTTKSDRGDVIALHPQLVGAMRAFRPPTAKPTDRVLPVVPSMSVLKADLAHAGIDYGNQEDGFADMHSMRKTLNMLMAREKTDRRTRQAQLRHSDPRLTENTYWDNALFVAPHSDEIGRLSPLPIETYPQGSEKDSVGSAPLAHQNGVISGHQKTSCGTPEWLANKRAIALAWLKFHRFSLEKLNKQSEPVSEDTGSSEKRVMRVELTTFTLAT